MGPRRSWTASPDGQANTFGSSRSAYCSVTRSLRSPQTPRGGCAALAVAAALNAELLGTATPPAPPAVEQGHRLAVQLGVLTIVAIAARAATLGLDARLSRLDVTVQIRRRTARLVAAGTALI